MMNAALPGGSGVGIVSNHWKMRFGYLPQKRNDVIVKYAEDFDFVILRLIFPTSSCKLKTRNDWNRFQIIGTIR